MTMFGSFPPSPLVGLRLQSLLGPGSRHCYGIITLITERWWCERLTFVPWSFDIGVFRDRSAAEVAVGEVGPKRSERQFRFEIRLGLRH